MYKKCNFQPNRMILDESALGTTRLSSNDTRVSVLFYSLEAGLKKGFLAERTHKSSIKTIGRFTRPDGPVLHVVLLRI